MRVNDAISGAVLAACGGAIAAIATTFPPTPGQSYGPGLFPSLIGLILVGCGALLILRGWRERAEQGWLGLDEWRGRGGAVANVALLLAALVFYILGAQRFGFFPSAFLILAVMMIWLRGPRQWPSSLVIAAVATTGIYIFFGRILQVPLPRDFVSNLF